MVQANSNGSVWLGRISVGKVDCFANVRGGTLECYAACFISNELSTITLDVEITDNEGVEDVTKTSVNRWPLCTFHGGLQANLCAYGSNHQKRQHGET